MHIEYYKNFIKSFKKRFRNNLKVKKQYERHLKMFIANTKNPLLKDHQLVGDKITLRAFSITGDIRIVYKKIGDRIIFLDIGTHNQVY